jgi:uncharacterized membrane protein
LTGWVAGAGAALSLGLAWPIIFPAIVRPEHYYGDGPGLLQVLLFAIIIATLAAVVGGIVGGKISVEGGEREQWLIAIIFGALFSLTFSCYMLWIFTRLKVNTKDANFPPNHQVNLI